MATSVLLRADAGGDLGTGHVYRCLALAQALHDAGAQTAFLSAALPQALRERLLQEGSQCLLLKSTPWSNADAKETARAARQMGVQWVVLDGYHFDIAHQEALRAEGLHVFMIDDYGHAERYSADIVLNQNVYASEEFYRHRGVDTKLLLGSRYAMLRREFAAFAGWTRETCEYASRLLVTLGGFDPAKITLRIVEAIITVDPPVRTVVALGAQHPDTSEVHAVAKDSPYVTVLEHARDMPQLMAEADMAISAGGTTSNELAYMQLPTLTVVLADNQDRVAEAFAERGCAVNLGRFEAFDEARLLKALSVLRADAQRRRAMAKTGRMLVDGEGAARVAMRLAGHRIRLRTSRDDDARLLWEWANDAETRRASFSSDPIPWEEHAVWFAGVLRDPLQHCFLAVDAEDRPVGQLRFAREGREATLSINVAPAERGKGYGKALVLAGARTLFRTTDTEVIHALVKTENAASSELFARAGFHREPPKEVDGHPALHFTLRRDMLAP